MVPIAKTRTLVDRSSMIGGGGRHIEGIGNGEDKRTLGDSYMILWKVVMDMVIFRTIFFELLVFFTFTLLILHSVC